MTAYLKPFLMLVLLFLVGGSQFAEAQGWIRLYGNSGNDRATAVLQTQDGGYFVTGYNTDPITFDKRQILIKTDPGGNVQWERLGPFGETTTASHVLELSGGNLALVADKLNASTLSDLGFLKLEPDGDTLIQKELLLPEFQEGQMMVQNSDGGFLAIGKMRYPAGSGRSDYDLFAVRTDSLGDTLWTRSYGGPGNDDGTSVVGLPDGGFAIAGSIRNVPGTNSQFYFVRIDSLGDTLWTRTYANGDVNLCYGLQNTHDNGFILAGATVFQFPTPQIQEWVIRTDSLGDTLWTSLIGGTEQGGENQKILELPNRDIVLVTYRELIKLDSSGQTIWSRYYQDYFPLDFCQTSDGGYMITGTHFVGGGANNEIFLMKVDSLGNSRTNHISGRVFVDANANCQWEPIDSALGGWNLRLQPGNRIIRTRPDGTWEADVDTGSTVVGLVPPNAYWVPDCPPGGQYTVNLPQPYDTLNGINLTAQPEIYCPSLRVNIGAPFLRRCFANYHVVHWRNEGPVIARNALVEVQMDTFFTVDSAEIAWQTPQNGNTFRFQIGDVGPGESGSFRIYSTLSCAAVFGQSHCVSAHIFPDSNCMPLNPLWDGASVELAASCDQDSVRFTISNVGANSMSSPGGLMVLEDDILKMQGNFQLGAGLDTVIAVPANGSTWVCTAEQRPGHPGNSRPLVALEGCGLDSNGQISLGFLTQYPQDDLNPWMDIDCQMNRAAYDPNEKRPLPEGIGPEHKITQSTDLQYTLHFQNTGTDTAFTVVIRDTLTEFLDPFSVTSGASSHPYTFNCYGNGILEWTFSNILLPDSNVNEPASHGFVKFEVEQEDGNMPGTLIENRVGIYFDFNAPVITNTAVHLVDEEENVWGVVNIDPVEPRDLPIKVYPNPFSQSATFDLGQTRTEATLEVWDLFGQLIYSGTFQQADEIPFHRGSLSCGLYLFRISDDEGKTATGRILIQEN